MGAQRAQQQRGIETRAALIEACGRVFSRMEFDTAKLRDISAEAEISLGSLYFHFGNKDDIAKTILDIQQERMGAVLSAVTEEPGLDSLERLLALLEGMAALISQDSIVQAGIRLLNSLPEEHRARGYGDYDAWQSVTRTLIVEGIVEGSMSPKCSVDEATELLNEIFVGAQVMSGMHDAWRSLPGRLNTARPLLTMLLTCGTPA